VDGNAKVAKGMKVAKKKVSVFSVIFCVLCGFSSIGVNLCQSVDGNAKVAKDTEDAKITQIRRGNRGAEKRRDAKGAKKCKECQG